MGIPVVGLDFDIVAATATIRNALHSAENVYLITNLKLHSLVLVNRGVDDHPSYPSHLGRARNRAGQVNCSG